MAVALPQIDQSRESWALFLFTLQLLICVTGVAVHEVAYEDHANALATVIGMGRALAPQIVVITATTVVAVEGYAMLAERYLRRRYREGRQEGRKEGRAEANEAWQAWYQRMLAAREEGREFDELPPTNGVSNGKP